MKKPKVLRSDVQAEFFERAGCGLPRGYSRTRRLNKLPDERMVGFVFPANSPAERGLLTQRFGDALASRSAQSGIRLCADSRRVTDSSAVAELIESHPSDFACRDITQLASFEFIIQADAGRPRSNTSHNHYNPIGTGADGWGMRRGDRMSRTLFVQFISRIPVRSLPGSLA